MFGDQPLGFGCVRPCHRREAERGSNLVGRLADQPRRQCLAQCGDQGREGKKVRRIQHQDEQLRQLWPRGRQQRCDKIFLQPLDLEVGGLFNLPLGPITKVLHQALPLFPLVVVVPLFHALLDDRDAGGLQHALVLVRHLLHHLLVRVDQPFNPVSPCRLFPGRSESTSIQASFEEFLLVRNPLRSPVSLLCLGRKRARAVLACATHSCASTGRLCIGRPKWLYRRHVLHGLDHQRQRFRRHACKRYRAGRAGGLSNHFCQQRGLLPAFSTQLEHRAVVHDHG